MLPLVTSFLAVALLAAGLGYALGLFLTGALGGASAAGDEPGPAAGDAGPQPGEATGSAAGETPVPGQDAAPPGEDVPPTGGEQEGTAEQPPAVAEPSEPASASPEGGGGDEGLTAGVPVEAAAVTVYVVQVGVFSTREGAETMLADVRAAGFDGVVVAGDGFRVWTGLFSQRERGRALSEAIAAAGFENFIAERVVGGGGVLPATAEEAAETLRAHLEALPGRIRRLAVAVEAAEGVEELAAEMEDAERDLERVSPPADLESVHEGLRRLYAAVRDLLERQDLGLGAGAHPALPAAAAQAAAEAAGILDGLPR